MFFLADEFRAMLNAVGDVSGGGVDETSNSGDRKKKKKSRWATTNDATEGKTFIPGMPTILPSNLNADQQEAYLGENQSLYLETIITAFYTLSLSLFRHL